MTVLFSHGPWWTVVVDDSQRKRLNENKNEGTFFLEINAAMYDADERLIFTTHR